VPGANCRVLKVLKPFPNRAVLPAEARPEPDWSQKVEKGVGKVNRYLYENLASNLEAQIDHWIRQAGREPNPEVAKLIRAKAEGLAYASRLLYAFEPEFHELVDCALRDFGE
jgi:hypothetical protein